jgi:hypothetical protein
MATGPLLRPRRRSPRFRPSTTLPFPRPAAHPSNASNPSPCHRPGRCSQGQRASLSLKFPVRKRGEVARGLAREGRTSAVLAGRFASNPQRSPRSSLSRRRSAQEFHRRSLLSRSPWAAGIRRSPPPRSRATQRSSQPEGTARPRLFNTHPWLELVRRKDPLLDKGCTCRLVALLLRAARRRS